ncbi:MAG: hypothetical protein AAFO72_07335, partial [Pseudomonadota bacterium]
MFGTLRLISRLVALTILVCLHLLPDRAEAHFSYADPRIVHIAEDHAGGIVILVRMPAPLALLPADWQGAEDTRTPPFVLRDGGETYLDRSVLVAQEDRFHGLLIEGLSVSLNGQMVVPLIGRTKIWLDADRPRFSTVKSALKTLGQPAPTSALPYYDVTLDVEFLIPDGALSQTIRLSSDLGRNFQVMDQFGTVVKLHRETGTETQAMIGVMEASFDGVQS